MDELKAAAFFLTYLRDLVQLFLDLLGERLIDAALQLRDGHPLIPAEKQQSLNDCLQIHRYPLL